MRQSLENNQICTIFEIKYVYVLTVFAWYLLKYLYLTLITAKSISISKVIWIAAKCLQGQGTNLKKKRKYKWEQQKKLWKYNREDCIVSLTWEWPSSATQLCMTTTRISRWNEMHFMLWRFNCYIQGSFLPKNQKEDYKNGNLDQSDIWEMTWVNNFWT